MNREAIIELIRAEAQKQGLPEAVALATAEVESGFNPNARGDLLWHSKRGGELYQKHVANNPRLAANPARLQPERWVSFGLFQLLSPHFVKPHEAPEVLADPQVNAERGIRFLARLYKLYEGDTDKVRTHYGAGNLNVNEATRAQLLGKFRKALAKWQGNGGNGPGGMGGVLLGALVVLVVYLARR